MIFIAAKFQVRAEYADRWPELSAEFTAACQAEAGCLWFDWSRDLEDPDTYVLLEAYRDQDAGSAHVNSEHFKTACRDLPAYLATTPQIVNCETDSEGWSELGEMEVD